MADVVFWFISLVCSSRDIQDYFLQYYFCCCSFMYVNFDLIALFQGHLWREALSLLTLAVSNSSSLVQPPTRGLPVDLCLFNQTLPGPTLQFTVDLRRVSSDLDLASTPVINSSWKQPQASQRRTRERLASVLNACGPGLALMSSPSVVFTDDQALLADKGTLYSSASEEAASSITSINHEDIIENSQPESQVRTESKGWECKACVAVTNIARSI